MRDKISVIIRSRNEDRWIGHAIQSVLDFIYKPEIIIVDNNSTDETENIVRHFTQDPLLNDKKNKQYTKIKIIKIDNYTPGKALNMGVKKCSNPHLMIISAHCVLKKLNLKKHIQDLKKHVCVFGNNIPIWNGKKITKRYIWSHFVNKRVVNMYSEMEKRHFIHNSIAMYDRKYLFKNPFDEHLPGKEDRYWANDVVKKGKSFLYDPDMEADHHYTEKGNTWKGIG
jgi:glycosyltransferase involved in cell wall biosynthesis